MPVPARIGTRSDRPFLPTRPASVADAANDVHYPVKLLKSLRKTKVWVQKRGLRAKLSIPLDNSVSSSDLNTFDVYFFQIGRT